jgi:hypothetical protein
MPFARFFLECHLLQGDRSLILPISMPVSALKLPVLQNNRKVPLRCCNQLRTQSNFERAVPFSRQKPVLT